jgi:ribosomal protein L23
LLDSFKVVKYPVSSEKSIRLMEAENKLIFRVDTKATSFEIKKCVEELFNVKVTKVNTFNSCKGEKRAYVRLSKDTPAIDVVTQMGLM